MSALDFFSQEVNSLLMLESISVQ